MLKFLSKDLSEFIEFDKYVTNLEHSENKIQINFKDGSSENFDFLVIAAGMIQIQKNLYVKIAQILTTVVQ